MVTKTEVLLAAAKAVSERGNDYGNAQRNFEWIAQYWTLHLQHRTTLPITLTATDVALMMDLLKTARLEHTPSHLDSWIDKAGYSAIGAELK